jgi:methylated-DNA-[protein]-cysteine S-methyltransferase
MKSLRHHYAHSPVGPLLLVADDTDRLCGLYMPDHRHGPAYPPGRHQAGGVIDHAGVQLDEYFRGDRRVFDLPLAMAGSPFQERVWEALLTIPYGATTSYGQIAADLGLPPASSRAVGAAHGRNPVSIVVPCHRVIGASGSLVGYGGGLPAKRYLLDHEARAVGAMLAV